MAARWLSADGQWRIRIVSVDGQQRFRIDQRAPGPDGPRWRWVTDTRNLAKVAQFVPLDQLAEEIPRQARKEKESA
jgi:hypothetical protein